MAVTERGCRLTRISMTSRSLLHMPTLSGGTRKGYTDTDAVEFSCICNCINCSWTGVPATNRPKPGSDRLHTSCLCAVPSLIADACVAYISIPVDEFCVNSQRYRTLGRAELEKANPSVWLRHDVFSIHRRELTTICDRALVCATRDGAQIARPCAGA